VTKSKKEKRKQLVKLSKQANDLHSAKINKESFCITAPEMYKANWPRTPVVSPIANYLPNTAM